MLNHSFFRGTKWNAIKKRIYERAAYLCEAKIKGRRCGKNLRNSCNRAIHHIIPYWASRDNSEKNLLAVCIDCHDRLERLHRWRWKHQPEYRAKLLKLRQEPLKEEEVFKDFEIGMMD